MCDSWICTDENLNITLNGDDIWYGFFVIAYTVFRFIEHVLGALYHQKSRELLQISPEQRFNEEISKCCLPTGVWLQTLYQFGRSFFAVLSFLLILEKNWIMFIFLIVFDVAFIPLRYYFQKEDIHYKPIKQELYDLFMNIDHDPNDETYNKLVIYLTEMKNGMKKDAAAKFAEKPKYRDMLF